MMWPKIKPQTSKKYGCKNNLWMPKCTQFDKNEQNPHTSFITMPVNYYQNDTILWISQGDEYVDKFSPKPYIRKLPLHARVNFIFEIYVGIVHTSP